MLLIAFRIVRTPRREEEEEEEEPTMMPSALLFITTAAFGVMQVLLFIYMCTQKYFYVWDRYMRKYEERKSRGKKSACVRKQRLIESHASTSRPIGEMRPSLQVFTRGTLVQKKIYSQNVVVLDVFSKSVRVFVTLESAREKERDEVNRLSLQIFL